MRPSDVVRRGADYLQRHDVDAPLSTAEQLLASVLATDRSGVYMREDPLRSGEARAFGRALCRRCSGVPTQHLTGETGFRHLILTVRPGVFVPRPETEIVVDAGPAHLNSFVGRAYLRSRVPAGVSIDALRWASRSARPTSRTSP